MTDRKPGLFKRLTSALFEEVDPRAQAASEVVTEVFEEDDPFQIRGESSYGPSRTMQVAGAQARFENRMRELVEQKRDGAAGKLQLLGLAEIKEQLGDRWEAIADKARRIAESVIERRLAPGDVFAPFEEDGFLVLFADLSEDQARFKSAAIGQEIHDRLMGELGAEGPGIRAFAANFLHLIPEGERPMRLADLDVALSGTTAVRDSPRPDHPGSGRPNAVAPAPNGSPAGGSVHPGNAASRAPAAEQRPGSAPMAATATLAAASPAGRPDAQRPDAQRPSGGLAPEIAMRAPSAREVSDAQAVLEARLYQVQLERKPTIVGKTQFIDLQKLKDEFGSRWESIVERARQIAHRVIEARIARSDVFSPVDADSFLILFAELDEEEARLKVAAIAREIHDRLLGELQLGNDVIPDSFVATIAPLQRPPIPNDPEIMAEIFAVLENTEPIRPPDRIAGMDADLRDRIGEIAISYRPTWFVPKGVLAVYDARVMRLVTNHRMAFGVPAYPTSDAAVVFEMDRAVLQAALTGVRRLAERKQTALVQTPLHLQSLTTHSGGQLIDLCRALPVELRHLLVVEITGLSGAPAGRLNEAIAAVKPFCRAVSVRVQFGFGDFEHLARQKVSSLGIDLEDPADQGATAPNLPALMTRFVAQTHQHKMTASLFGIVRKETVGRAREAGFDYLNGPAVAPLVRFPSGIAPFPPKH